MKKRTPSRPAKRLLSIALALSLVIGCTAVIGSVTAQASLSVTTAAPAVPAVYFGAPEQIYLTPSTAASNGASTTWVAPQHYIGNTFTNTSAANLASFGTVSAAKTSSIIRFYGAGVGSIKITGQEIDGTTRQFTPVASTIYNAGSTGGTASANNQSIVNGTAQTGEWVAFALDTANSRYQNRSRMIRWKAVYSYTAAPTVEYTAYAYTYVYAPDYVPVAHSARVQRGTTGPIAEYIMWINGLHTNGKTQTYTLPASGASGKAMIYTLLSNVTQESNVQRAFTDYYSGSSGGGTLSRSDTGQRNDNALQTATGQSGTLYIDSSRYATTNTIKDIPNVSAYIYRHTWGGTYSKLDGNATSIHWNTTANWPGTSDGNLQLNWKQANGAPPPTFAQPGYTTSSVTAPTGDTMWDKINLNRTSFNLIFHMYSSTNGGLWPSSNWTVQTGTGADAHWMVVFFQINLTKTAKGTLRTTLQTAIRDYPDKKYFANADTVSPRDPAKTCWEYFEAQKTAIATQLCTLSNTTTTTTGLDNAMSDLVKTGKAYADHYSLALAINSTNRLLQENQSFTAGATVTATRNTTLTGGVDFTNYAYVSHEMPDGTSKTDASSAVVAQTDGITWKFYYNPIYDVVYASTLHDGGTMPAALRTTYDTTTGQTAAGGPTRTGYGFAGWKVTAPVTSPNYGEVYEPGAALPNTMRNTPGEVTLTAQWTAKQYDVEYNPGLGTGGGTRTVTYGSTYLAAGIPTAARTGYVFGGWFTQTGGSGTQIQNATSVSSATLDPDIAPPDAAATFHAYWTPENYLVTFDHFGGTLGGAASTGPVGVTYNGAYTIPAGLPFKAGYAFQGWYYNTTTKIETGMTVNSATLSGDSLANPLEPTVFYAKWEQAQYQLVFDLQGGAIGDPGEPGAGDPQTRQGSFGTIIKIPSPAPKLTGYRFCGWFTQPDGGGDMLPATFTVGESILSQASIEDPSVPTTYYAFWEVELYTILWSLEGGTHEGYEFDPQTNVTYGGDYTLPTPDPEREDYNFGGWWTKENGGGVQILDNDTVDDGTLTPMSLRFPAVPTIFYAKWLYTGEYNVTYDLQGGNIDGDENLVSATVSLGTTFADGTTIPDDPSRTGYTFDGWYTQKNGGGILIEDGVTVDDTVLDPRALGDFAFATTYYAKWIIVDYTVVFDAQGGTPAQQSDTVNFEGTYTLPAQPTRTGYGFAGWFTEDELREITSGGPVNHLTISGESLDDPDIPTRFYAKWDAIKYTLHYDVAGVGTVPGDKVITYGSTIMDPVPAMTKPGYALARWDVLINGDVVGTLGATATPTNKMSTVNGQTVTLKAIWTANDVGYHERVYLAGADGGYSGYTDYDKPGYTDTLAVADPADYTGGGLYIYDATAGLTPPYPNKLSGVIAADGNTLLVLHYQRAKMKLTVNLDGGTGSLAGNLGSFPWESVQTLPEPVKPGWEFDGWTKVAGGADALINGNDITIGKADTEVKAAWKAGDARYYVDVYLEDAPGNYPAPGSPSVSLQKTRKTNDAFTFDWEADTDCNAYAADYVLDGGSSVLAGTIPDPAVSTLRLKLYLKRVTYDLFVDRNGGTGGSGAPVTGLVGNYRWGEEVALTPPALDGFVFSHWSGVTMSGGKVVVNKAATTAKAEWTPADGTQYFVDIYLQEAGGGYSACATYSESGVTNATATVGADYLNDPLYPAIDGGQSNHLSDTIVPEGDMRLTMYLQRKTVTLTVVEDGDTAAIIAPAQAAYLWGQTVAVTNPKKDGYVFNTWLTSGDAVYSGNVNTGSLVLGSGNTTITALWTPANDTVYAVEIYLEKENGGGYPTTADETLTGYTGITGETAVAVLTDYSNALYTFDSTYGGNKLSGPITPDGKLALKLYYKRILVKLTVDAGDGGTGGGLAGSFPWGSTQVNILASLPVTAPAGMKFKAWEVTPSNAGASGTDVKLGKADTVVKAIWEADTAGFQVKVYLQNAAGGYDLAQTIPGTGAPTGGTKTITKSAYNPNSASYRDDAPGGGFTDVTSITPVRADGNNTFELYYPRAFVQLSVITTGATTGSVPAAGDYMTYYWGQQVAITNPQRTGYLFSGWTVAGDGAGFIDGKLVVGATATTITANWIEPASNVGKYMVDVYLQEADGSYDYGTPSLSFLKVGKIGTGAATVLEGEWDDSNYEYDGGETNVKAADLIGDFDTSAQLELYYKRKSVSLEVEPDGGTGGTASQTGLRWGQELTLAEPTRAGYTFSHWTVDEGAGAGIVDGVLTLGTGKTVITAHWIADPAPVEVIYTVEIYLMNANGAYGAAAQTVKKSALPGTNTASAAAGDWSGAGYTFASGAVTAAALAADGTTTPALKLYYKRDAASFTVQDGGSNTVSDPSGLVWGKTVTLDAEPTKAGFVFVCWSMVSGTGSLAGNVLTLGAGLTVVKANWAAESGAPTATYKVEIYLQKADGT